MLFSFLMSLFFKNQIIYEFNLSKNIARDWFITTDTVMGGVSKASFTLNQVGNGFFSGNVSTVNNGGFTLAYHFTNVDCKGKKQIQLKIKGDGKRYQLRIKQNKNQKFWYIQYFQTSTDWETIYLDLDKFYPSYRGKKLNEPNFTSNCIEEIAFLIGNKTSESFELTIDAIKLK